MEKEADFGKNGEFIVVIVILCADGIAQKMYSDGRIAFQQLNYLTILPSDYIFCAIPSAHKITIKNNFLFLPKVALLSIYLF